MGKNLTDGCQLLVSMLLPVLSLPFGGGEGRLTSQGARIMRRLSLVKRFVLTAIAVSALSMASVRLYATHCTPFINPKCDTDGDHCPDAIACYAGCYERTCWNKLFYPHPGFEVVCGGAAPKGGKKGGRKEGRKEGVILYPKQPICLISQLIS